MVHRLSILFIIFVFMPCYAAQEPATKRRKIDHKVSTLQEMAQKVVVRSALDLFQSPDAPEIFKKDPLKVLDMAREYLHPCVEPIIIAKLLKKYKATIAAYAIRFKKEIKGAVDTIARVLCFNRQGNLLACGGLRSAFGGHVTVQDIETGELLNMRCEDEVTALAFNGMSDQLAIGYKWGSIVIVSLEGKEIQQLVRQQDDVTTLDYSADGIYLVSACQDGKVCIFDVSNGQCIRTLSHTDSFDLPLSVSYVQLLDDGTIYSAGHGWGHVWDAQGVQQYKYPCQTGCMVQNGSRGYFMWKDKKLEVRGFYNELLMPRLTCYRALAKACSKVFSLDGNLLAVGLSHGSIYLYDCPSYQQAIEPLSILQALYIKYKLDEKAEYRLCGGISPFAKYLILESDACKKVGSSLPDAFKKIIT